MEWLWGLAWWVNGAAFASWMAWRANAGRAMPGWWRRLIGTNAAKRDAVMLYRIARSMRDGSKEAPL